MTKPSPKQKVRKCGNCKRDHKGKTNCFGGKFGAPFPKVRKVKKTIKAVLIPNEYGVVTKAVGFTATIKGLKQYEGVPCVISYLQ